MIDAKEANSDNVGVNEKLLIEEKIKLNYFPNDQTKHIDYVIQFKDNAETDANPEFDRIRKKFIDQLVEKEKFEIQKIVKKKDNPQNTKSTYLLLHCSLERLMEEAERMRLELPLKNASSICS